MPGLAPRPEAKSGHLWHDVFMPEMTFRDFAAAIMQNARTRAAEVLQALLELDAEPAAGAANHFAQQMAAQGQAFMMKSMGLRTVLTSGTDDEIGALLRDCFGLDSETAAAGVKALRRRYPAS
jgi:hypothetical protein